MAGKNDNFDALMAMMALKHIMDDTKDIEIHPFTCEVTVTPTSISCSSSVQNDIGLLIGDFISNPLQPFLSHCCVLNRLSVAIWAVIGFLPVDLA